MSAERSQHELKRLVEEAVASVCDLPRRGIWLCAEAVEARPAAGVATDLGEATFPLFRLALLLR